MAGEMYETNNSPGFTPDLAAGLAAFDEHAALFDREQEAVSARHGMIRSLDAVTETFVFSYNDGITGLMDRFGPDRVLDRIITEYTTQPEALNPFSLLVGFIPEAADREAFYTSVTDHVAAQTYPKSWGAAYIQRHAAESLRKLDSPTADGGWTNKNAARELGALLTDPVSGPLLREVFIYAHTGTGTVDAMRLAKGWAELHAELKHDFIREVYQLDIQPRLTTLMAELTSLEAQILAPIRAGVDTLIWHLQQFAVPSDITPLLLPEARTRLETVVGDVQALMGHAEAEYAAAAATLHHPFEARRMRVQEAGEAFARYVELLKGQL